MNYGNIKKNDIANGEGVRVSLFVSGCRNHCKGCFNPETWDFRYGKQFGDDELKEIITELSKPYVAGLSILGGDPMEPENKICVTAICRIIKYLYPNKTIWLYTGYNFEQIATDPLMRYLDMVVDGKFEIDKKNISLQFRGSENQRIIDVRESIRTGKIVEAQI